MTFIGLYSLYILVYVYFNGINIYLPIHLLFCTKMICTSNGKLEDLREFWCCDAEQTTLWRF